MNRRLTSLICGIALAAAPSGRADAEPIPLEQIWAHGMPGTRDVRELEPKRDTSKLSRSELLKGSLVLQIVQSLSSREWPKQGEQAGPAFAVEGVGREALANAQIFLANRGKVIEGPSARWFPADTDLSLVFYSYSCTRYVRIVSVDQNDNQVIVKYRFVSHLSANMTTHFALIPLGKLQPGAVRVTIEQMPPVNEFGMEDTPLRNSRKYVCESTSFGIK